MTDENWDEMFAILACLCGWDTCANHHHSFQSIQDLDLAEAFFCFSFGNLWHILIWWLMQITAKTEMIHEIDAKTGSRVRWDRDRRCRCWNTLQYTNVNLLNAIENRHRIECSMFSAHKVGLAGFTWLTSPQVQFQATHNTWMWSRSILVLMYGAKIENYFIPPVSQHRRHNIVLTRDKFMFFNNSQNNNL